MTSEGYREKLDRAVAFAGVSHEFFARAKAEELVELARRHLGDPSGLDALDAGCGIGLTDQHLLGRFRSLTGTDLSPEALGTAAGENPEVAYRLAETERLPFEDDAFDLTFAVNVVQVVSREERARFVSELARVARPGGLVTVFEHNPRNPLTRLVVRRFELGSEVRMLSMDDTARLLHDAGLTPVERGYMVLFPSRRRHLLQLERALRRVPLGAQYYLAARS